MNLIIKKLYLQGGPSLKRNESIESVCSVASTASFSYVPISNNKNKNNIAANKKQNGGDGGFQQKKSKIIPLGPTCGQETYKQRVDQRRKRVVQDLNISLTTKYKLQPAEYSPPNTLMRHNVENLSAISGPLLPSGPNLYVESPKLQASANSRSNKIEQDDSSTNSDFEEQDDPDQACVL